jgi:hypothetical protein
MPKGVIYPLDQTMPKIHRSSVTLGHKYSRHQFVPQRITPCVVVTVLVEARLMPKIAPTSHCYASAVVMCYAMEAP